MFSVLLQLTPREALLEIYTLNGGPSWIGATNWNTASSICTWAGVHCNGNQQVVGLDLSGFGLIGQLANVFDSFPYLKSLYMNDELMASTIPLTICQLSNLQYFQANNAGLTGPLPECLCQLQFLQYFYADSNALTGPIPVCMGTSLPFLREIHLRCNAITGTIPIGFANLTFLTEFRVQCNVDLSCVSPLSANPNIIFLCGMDGCEDCTIPGTQCPDSVIVPNCGVYVRQIPLV